MFGADFGDARPLPEVASQISNVTFVLPGPPPSASLVPSGEKATEPTTLVAVGSW